MRRWSHEEQEDHPQVFPRSARTRCPHAAEHRGEYPSLWAAIESIAPKIGCEPQTLHDWVRKHEIDTGMRDGVTSDERERLKALGAREQGTAPRQRDPEAGERVFRPGEARPPTQVLNDFIDRHRDTYGVEPICKVLQVAASGYRRHAARARDPSRRSARAQRDDALMLKTERVWQANLQVYGADKVWRQMKREGTEVARCTVERLKSRLGLCGAIRGKVVRTTVPEPKQPCPLDRVNRQFKAIVRTSYGSRTSATSRSGRAGCTWPSRSTCTPGASSAGGCEPDDAH